MIGLLQMITICSNKRLGQELVKKVATFKEESNGLESRKGDWADILRVVGPETTLKFVDSNARSRIGRATAK